MKRTDRAIDEDPQKPSPNGLQALATVQLSQDNLSLYDVVLQDNLEQPLIHRHHFICRGKNRLYISRLKHTDNAVDFLAPFQLQQQNQHVRY